MALVAVGDYCFAKFVVVLLAFCSQFAYLCATKTTVMII